MKPFLPEFRRNEGRSSIRLRSRPVKSAPLQYQRYVKRTSVILASLLILSSICAQSDTSLTKEFADLSAKERNRIAKKEQSDSENDVAYQAVMNTAEALFRDKRFEESLEQYRIARNMRPYNVFPKVKIQDLNALIQLRTEQKLEPTGSENGIMFEKLYPTAEPIIAKEVPPIAIEIPQEPPTEPVPTVEDPRSSVNVSTNVPEQKVRSKVPMEKKSSAPTNANTKLPLPDGVVERYSKEGRALVCEREVTKAGKMCVYRRVIHPWGDITYFKDQVPISERAWAEAFGE